MEIKGKILCKKSDNKAFKMGDNWYNINDNVIPILEKINKGDFVTIEYEKKGVSRYVSNLSSGDSTPKSTTSQKETPTGFNCSVCGKTLKDGKYKKCYECNSSKAEKKEEPKKESTTGFTCEDCGAELKDDKYKKCYKCGKKSFKTNSYDNPEKTAQIQRGNALNAAASVASSQQFADIDTPAQFTLELAERFLVWLRGE